MAQLKTPTCFASLRPDYFGERPKQIIRAHCPSAPPKLHCSRWDCHDSLIKVNLINLMRVMAANFTSSRTGDFAQLMPLRKESFKLLLRLGKISVCPTERLRLQFPMEWEIEVEASKDYTIRNSYFCSLNVSGGQGRMFLRA